MGDGDYMFAFQQVVMPIAREFDPDFVIGNSLQTDFKESSDRHSIQCADFRSLVAAGFDAAAGDELGGCFVTPACYAHMTHMLTTLAGGKVAVCLEVRTVLVDRGQNLNKLLPGWI
jgi:histone deacetylase 6